jgi:hypothetical protein
MPRLLGQKVRGVNFRVLNSAAGLQESSPPCGTLWQAWKAN